MADFSLIMTRASSTKWGKVMKILIVDDDAIVVQSYVRILKMEGIETQVANTWEEGEKLLRAVGASFPFALILTDVSLLIL